MNLANVEFNHMSFFIAFMHTQYAKIENIHLPFVALRSSQLKQTRKTL
jgi:hypothetical protein